MSFKVENPMALITDNFRSVEARMVGCVNQSTIAILDGKDFSDYRTPIMVFYVTQNAGFVFVYVYKNAGSLVCASPQIQSPTAYYSNNDIFIEGIGDWGQGFAIGLK